METGIEANPPLIRKKPVVYTPFTGSLSNGTGIWVGRLTGSRKHNKDLILGDIILKYSSSECGGHLNIKLKNLVNATLDRECKVPFLAFDSVPLLSDREFNFGVPENRIRGAFYASDGKGVRGNFETLGMLGAYAASCQ